MVNKIKASLELSLLAFILALSTIGVGIFGILEIKEINKGSKELYQDRMIPIGQLGEIRHYLSDMLIISNKVNQKQIVIDDARNRMTRNLDSIHIIWNQYSRTSFTDTEKINSSKTIVLLNEFSETVRKLKLSLEKNDIKTFNRIVQKELYPSVTSLSVDINDLIFLQLKEGKNIFENNFIVYEVSKKKFLLLMIIIFVFSIPLFYYLLKKNQRIISKLNYKDEKLFQVEQNYRDFINFAEDSILILDKKNKIVDLNESATNLFGFSREELLEIEIIELIYPDETNQISDIALAKKIKSRLVNGKVKRKDGTFIDAEITNWSMNGGGSLGIIRDITEKKSIEAIIKHSEEKYRYLFNNNPAHIIIWDCETLKVLEVNNTMLDVHGYSKTEWENMTILDHRYKEDHQKTNDFASLILNNDETVFETRGKYLKKNGEEMIMEITSHKINDLNNKNAVLSLARDITEQVKAENELIENKEKLRLFIEHSPASLAMFDNDMRFIAATQTWMKDYNLLGQDIIGKNHYEVLPAISHKWRDIHQRCLKGAVEKCKEDLYIKADGTVEWVSWEIHPWFNVSNEIGGIILFAEVITERKKATELFENIFQNSPDTIIYVDKNFIIKSINKSTSLGLSIDELIGTNCVENLPKYNQEFIREKLNKCLTTSESQEFEFELNKGNWSCSRYVPIINNDEVTHIMIFSTDITTRKQAENKLRQSEERYHSLIEHAGDAIFVIESNSNIVDANTSASQMLGYSREELLNMKVSDVCPSINMEAFYLQWDLIAKNKILLTENKFQRKDGSIVEVEVNRKMMDNEKYLSIVRDVSERKKIENELIENKEKLRLFIEHSPASLAMFDTNMRYIARSHSWALDYNLTDQDIIGKNHYEIFPHLSQEWKDTHQLCLQGNIERKEEDFFFREDGKLEWIRWELHPWKLASGEIGGIVMFVEIITERKQATEMFKYQFENSPDTILYVNKQFKIESINRESSVLLTGKSIGADCINILPHHCQSFVREKFIKCFETRENQEFEFELLKDNWSCTRLVPIVNNGEVNHVMIFSTNITTRKQAENKLLQSEERYRVLTENISEAIILVNKNFEIEYLSPSGERISGYSSEEVKSKTIFDFIHPDDLEKNREFFIKAISVPGVSVQKQLRTINKKGKAIWVEGTIVNLLGKNSEGAYVINYRDITNRKKLEEQQALMASIVNSSDDAIISKNIDGIVTSWNLGAERILGYTAAEMIGTSIEILIPSINREEEETILKEIRAGNSIEHFETKRVKKNGNLIDVSMTISPVRDALGNVVGASKIMRDISEYKETQEELIRYNAELEKANSELDRFVYSASHDLRAPLKSILGLVSISKDYANPENEQLLECLSMLNNSVFKLDNFIEDILSYSRNARMELDKDIIDFEELITKIREKYQFIDGIDQLKVQIQINSESVFVADSRRISIIFNNLLSNAFKYRDETKEESTLKIIFTNNRHSAIIKVEDNGIGIVDKDKEKVFNMFYRATMLSTGSGLGLYIVKEAIDKLGGKIKIESEFGLGTTFTIEIPNQINLLDKKLPMISENFLKIN